MFHKADVESDKVIRYLDVCPRLEDVEELVKYTVVPPKSMYHPVFPFTANGKFLFPLCKTCALEENQHNCHHAERSITGTWVTEGVHSLP
ncbi:hypothetical protein J437_LFUL013231 [Ladona fulva]|uniref:Uncharacterized protein n=1 Tax=Ladona fulva TaxID=123851 RepID=A0A8K0K4S2_LADFU|nr:hypothetical protein J437_LFUL013231 [Ladona fulva]